MINNVKEVQEGWHFYYYLASDIQNLLPFYYYFHFSIIILSLLLVVFRAFSLVLSWSCLGLVLVLSWSCLGLVFGLVFGLVLVLFLVLFWSKTMFFYRNLRLTKCLEIPLKTLIKQEKVLYFKDF